jgi:hypothetical protein
VQQLTRFGGWQDTRSKDNRITGAAIRASPVVMVKSFNQAMKCMRRVCDRAWVESSLFDRERVTQLPDRYTVNQYFVSTALPHKITKLLFINDWYAH